MGQWEIACSGLSEWLNKIFKIQVSVISDIGVHRIKYLRPSIKMNRTQVFQYLRV